MALLKKDAAQLQTQENDIHKSLKAWYLTPGIQRDLRNKENGAVQTVLDHASSRHPHGTSRTKNYGQVVESILIAVSFI